MTEENKTDDIKIHIEPTQEIDNENLIKTCCGRVSDKRLLAFVASISLSSIITIFSCYQLSKDNMECTEQNMYSGLIMFILGFWLKSPIQA
jgi:hypothetical protein